MSEIEIGSPVALGATGAKGWSELWRKEDWWAIWIGLGIVVLGCLLFAEGSSLKWIAVTPPKWSSWGQLGAHFADSYPRYIAQFAAWLVIFSLALGALGHRPRAFIAAFAFLYALSVVAITHRPMGPGQPV